MTGNHRFIPLRALALAALYAVAANAQAADADAYRETYPRVAIDPARGVAGADAADFGTTLQYWQDEKSLEQNSQWIGDLEHEWKLNWKFLDLDRSDDMHPGYLALEKGEKLFKFWAKREPSFRTCLGEGKIDLKGLAASYPKYDPKLKKIMTVESRVEHCAQTALWENFKQGSPANNQISLYFKSLSAYTPIKVDTGSAEIMASYQRGEKLFYAKVGQYNFACASCHTSSGLLGQRFRGQVPTSPFGDAAHFPTYRTALGDIESLQQRFMRCNLQARTKALPPGDPAYTDLEVFYTVLSNDYPVSVPSVR
jgi:sulfur-oxidizing protein SoxA